MSWTLIPNILDFKEKPPVIDSYSKDFREQIGIDEDALVVLQPTRIVSRKGIEISIELVKRLEYPKAVLLITHDAGDEGFEYAEWLKEYACEHAVDLRLVSIHIADPWSENGNGRGQYSLWDVYPFADFITYPSLYEGFGNAFLEAIYFKKPMLINRYATFVRDIEPLGFDLAVMDGFLSKKTVQSVIDILESSKRRKKWSTGITTLPRNITLIPCFEISFLLL